MNKSYVLTEVMKQIASGGPCSNYAERRRLKCLLQAA